MAIDWRRMTKRGEKHVDATARYSVPSLADATMRGRSSMDETPAVSVWKIAEAKGSKTRINVPCNNRIHCLWTRMADWRVNHRALKRAGGCVV